MNPFGIRRYVISAIIIFISLIFIIRLFILQVVDPSYKLSADNNVLRYEIQYPARGLIYDRNGTLLVYNEAAYDLMVIPRQTGVFDTADFCKILEIPKELLIKKISDARDYSTYKPSVFLKQLSSRRYAVLQEKLYRFPGFFVQTRTLRKYPKEIAAHVLGYVGEVDTSVTNYDNYYKPGDYIGISGLEKSYEKALRGKKGVKIFLVDVHNRIKGSFHNGRYDTAAVVGMDIISTLDAKLQVYGEMLMKNKTGSIVAIEPGSGEVLAMITSPSYDPNLLVGRKRTANYLVLSTDSLEPLFDNALMAKYPPGSIFKIVQALIGLQEGVINKRTSFPCDKSIINCHSHPPPSNLKKAIQYSCNPYFYRVYKRIIQQGKSRNRFKDSEIGLRKWYEHVTSFGFGEKLKIDLPNVKPGLVPDVEFYDKWYGKNRWAFSTIYSNGIGQGEVEVIPLQMANMAVIIANKGYYYMPHLVKSIGESKGSLKQYNIQHITTIDVKHFNIITDAMQSVIEEPGGTARRARIDSITVCGKTGTAENPHGEDHSVFIAFAPREDPRIAIAVYVENAGFGGTWAAPIASLMIEKYLTDTIKNPLKEKRILEYKQY